MESKTSRTAKITFDGLDNAFLTDKNSFFGGLSDDQISEILLAIKDQIKAKAH